MAPKGKPDPKAAAKGAKPPAKAPAKPPAKPKEPGTLTEQEIQIYLFCALCAAFSILTIIVMTIMYLTTQEIKDSMDYSMHRLKGTLTSTVFLPEPGGAMEVANTVEELPKNFNDAYEDYDDKKKRYQLLFQKAMRSSSGPWKLHRRSLYYFVKGEKTWYDAENFCVFRDAHLASVLDDEEQDFITSHTKQASWIGLSDENRKGVWEWTDGSMLQEQYWSEGEPSNMERVGESDLDCTLVVPSSTNQNWKGDDCHKLYGWVCKQKLDFK